MKETKCTCGNYQRFGCPIHDVSECCEAEKYLDKEGYSYCQKCNRLFTGKDWNKKKTKCDCNCHHPKSQCNHIVDNNIYQRICQKCGEDLLSLPKSQEWEEEKFFNLMQEYRHAPLTNQAFVIEKYEAVKSFIHSTIAKERASLNEKIVNLPFSNADLCENSLEFKHAVLALLNAEGE